MTAILPGRPRARQNGRMAAFTTERGFDRLVNFSDATVAIALTLLVLPLVSLADDAAHTALGTVLSEHRGTLLAFLLSFVVIAAAWIEHHRFFEMLIGYDYPLLWLNLVWLFAIVALPFSTELIEAASTEDRGVLAVYIGNLLLSFGTIAAMRVLASRTPELLNPDARARFELVPGLTLLGLTATAFVVAMIVPRIGLWPLLLLAVSGPVSRLFRLRRPAGRL